MSRNDIISLKGHCHHMSTFLFLQEGNETWLGLAGEDLEAGVDLAHCLGVRPWLLDLHVSLVTLETLLDVPKLDMK